MNTNPPNKAYWLVIAALASAAAMLIHGPIAQLANYHHFADQRSWWHIPHAADVLSNLPFLCIGIWGLMRLAKHPQPSQNAWRIFSAALIFTAAGSSIYHWHPTNGALVFDRLPIAWACSALMCAFLSERVHANWGHAKMLYTALLLSSASVAWWWWTEQQGQDDLRAYLFMQFLPLLLAPIGLALKLKPRTAFAVQGHVWLGALLLYAAAKGLEMADHSLLHTLGFVGGHTLKHLVASGAAGWLLWGAARTTRH
jgi:hypothetical protein